MNEQGFSGDNRSSVEQLRKGLEHSLKEQLPTPPLTFGLCDQVAWCKFGNALVSVVFMISFECNDALRIEFEQLKNSLNDFNALIPTVGIVTDEDQQVLVRTNWARILPNEIASPCRSPTTMIFLVVRNNSGSMILNGTSIDVTSGPDPSLF